MRGANPVRGPNECAEVLEVQEIFSTIQGEGPFTGVPAIFVRVAGCNLRCHFCDTDFESSYQGDNCQYVVDVAEKVMHLANGKIPLCVVTGGEPFRQGPALASLIDRLCRQRMHVQVETAGTLWHENLDSLINAIQRNRDYPHPGRWSIVCSPKTPKINHVIKHLALAFKYILSANDISPLDGLPLLSTQKVGDHAAPWRDGSINPRLIYIQPMDMGEFLEARMSTDRNTKAAVEVVKKHGYTLSLQTHKIIGLP